MNSLERLLRVDMRLEESGIPPPLDASSHRSPPIPTLLCDMPVNLLIRISMDDTCAADLQAVREFFPDIQPHHLAHPHQRLEQLGTALLKSIAITPFGLRHVAGPTPSSPLPPDSPSSSFLRSSTDCSIPSRRRASSLNGESTSHNDSSFPSVGQKEQGSVEEGEEDKRWGRDGHSSGGPDGSFMYGTPYFMEEPWDERPLSLFREEGGGVRLSPPRLSTTTASALSGGADASSTCLQMDGTQAEGIPGSFHQPQSPSSPLPAPSSASDETLVENKHWGPNFCLSNPPVVILARTQVVHAEKMECTQGERSDVDTGRSTTFSATYHFPFRVPSCLLEKRDSPHDDHHHSYHHRHCNSTTANSRILDKKEGGEEEGEGAAREGVSDVGRGIKASSTSSTIHTSDQISLAFVMHLLLWQTPTYLCGRFCGATGDQEIVPLPLPVRVGPESVFQLMEFVARKDEGANVAHSLLPVTKADPTVKDVLPLQGMGAGQGSHGIRLDPKNHTSRMPNLAILGCGGNFFVHLSQPLRCHTLRHQVSSDYFYLLISVEVVNTFYYPIHLYDSHFDWYTTRIVPPGTLSSSLLPGTVPPPPESLTESDPSSHDEGNGGPAVAPLSSSFSSSLVGQQEKEKSEKVSRDSTRQSLHGPSSFPTTWRSHADTTSTHQRMGPSWKDSDTVYLLPQVLTATPIHTPSSSSSSLRSPFFLPPGERHVFSFRLQLAPQAQFSLQYDQKKPNLSRSVGCGSGKGVSGGGAAEKGESERQHSVHQHSCPLSVPSHSSFQTVRLPVPAHRDLVADDVVWRVLSSGVFRTNIYFDYEVHSSTTTGTRLTRAHEVYWSFGGS